MSHISPIIWLILYIFFILLFFLFLINIYYLFLVPKLGKRIKSLSLKTVTLIEINYHFLDRDAPFNLHKYYKSDRFLFYYSLNTSVPRAKYVKLF